MIKVLIAEDHSLIRAGIYAMLRKSDNIEIVGEAVDGEAAVNLARELRPNVVLMDISMPKLNGYEAMIQILAMNYGCEVIMLSMHAEKDIIQKALAAGASGYLLKSTLQDELPLAIRAAIQRGIFLSPEVADILNTTYLTEEEKPATINPLDVLTLRERELMKLVAEGKTNLETAAIMKIGVRTVEKHRSNLMRKLKINDVTGLVRLAIKYGIISLDDI